MSNISPLRPDPDDDHWFALLTGHEVPEAHPETVREAQLLRQTILAEASEAASPPATAEVPAGLDRLLGRLRAEGLLTPRQPWWRQPRTWSLLAVAATVLCSMPWVMRALQPEPTEVIKTLTLPHFLYAADPVAQTQSLQTALRAQGITARVQAQGPGHYLTATLPQPVPEAVLRVLSTYGLDAPADGQLHVVIQPQEGQ